MPPLARTDITPFDSYAAVLAAVGQAIVVADQHGRIVFWNEPAERLYEWSATKTLGQPIGQFLNAGGAGDFDAHFWAALAGETWSGPAVINRRDGSQLSVLVRQSPMLETDENLPGVVVTAVEIRDRHFVAAAAQALSAILASTDNAMFTKSLAGTILDWNPGAERLYGYPAADAIGRHVSLIDPEQTGAEVRAIRKTVAAGGTVIGLETVHHRRDGSEVELSLTASPVYDERRVVVAVSVVSRDISDRRQLERGLAELATHDPLTGLPNRMLLMDRLNQALARTRGHNRPLTVLYLEVDRIQAINLANGHDVGDQLLIEVAQRLRASAAPADTVARFNDDAFVVVREKTDLVPAKCLAVDLAIAVHLPTDVEGLSFPASVSVGIALSPQRQGVEPDELVRNARTAMLEGKARAPGGWCVFDVAMETRSKERLAIGRDLALALAAGDLAVHYQPVIDLATGQLLGVEALARWQHPERGWIPPGLFVPLAEELGFISELDDWVAARACLDLAWLRQRAGVSSSAYLAINVGGSNVGPELVERLQRRTGEAGLPLEALVLEVTETALLADAPGATRVLQTLRDLGAGVALDAFGTGYSSLIYLRQLPLTSIKIDWAFVQHIAVRSDDLAIAAAVVDLGRAVGLRTIAAGVETSEQLAVLRQLGCRAGQGTLWAAALPRDALAILLQEAVGGFLVATPDAAPGRSGPRAQPATNMHGLHRMLQLHRDGASLATIAAALNTEDYRTPSGRRWATASVARVIADRAFAAQRRSTRHQIS